MVAKVLNFMTYNFVLTKEAGTLDLSQSLAQLGSLLPAQSLQAAKVDIPTGIYSGNK